MRRIIKSADEAIDALGGPRAVGALLGVGESVVWNWRVRGFPAHRYRDIVPLLQEEGLRFLPDVFARMGKSKHNGGR